MESLNTKSENFLRKKSDKFDEKLFNKLFKEKLKVAKI